jgi:GTPase SAR1 family protein
MAHDQAYYEAEKRIEEALKSGATKLDLSSMELNELPESIGQLTQLRALEIADNHLTALPDWVGNLAQLEELNITGNRVRTLPEAFVNLKNLSHMFLGHNDFREFPELVKHLPELRGLFLHNNKLTELPEWLKELSNLTNLTLSDNPIYGSLPSLEKLKKLVQLDMGPLSEDSLNAIPPWLQSLTNLQDLSFSGCNLRELPNWLSELKNLLFIDVSGNLLNEIPSSLIQLEKLEILYLESNPLKPELKAAYEQGLEAIRLYFRAGPVIPVYEAKLILVGEGEVGKTCLMDALLGKDWQEHPSTHGIEIQQVNVSYLVEGNHEDEKASSFELIQERIITLNGWDFGGQRVYRPTHQLFFSAPAVYLVVWKPREGPQQGFVKEWIQLVKRREPGAKIIVVATHGGPQQRQPDIDRQELWELFGKETVIDFFWVDSKPDENGNRKGIEELKLAVAKVAADLPEVGRSVPKSFQDVREALKERDAPYLPLDEVLAICHQHKMDDEIADLFIKISHRLGHLTHYETDPTLRDIVILRPDWLATAMSYVLDDAETRKNQGLVKFSRLGLLWNDPTRPVDTRYPESLHRIFLRLMERFDLSYRVAGLSKDEESNPVSLIAQLVPDTTPEEALYKAWPNEVTSGDIQQMQICRIVDAGNSQSANAEGLFYQLIVRLHKFSMGRAHWDDSVHWQRGLVLDANYNGRALLRHVGNDIHITVRAPYPERFLAMLTEEVKYLVESFWEGLRCDVTVPCLNENPCIGLFEVSKLIENKKRGRPEVPCSICNEWQSIDQLLSNAPAATQPVSLDTLLKEFAQVKDTLNEVNDNTRRILSQVDKSYADLIKLFTDEAKEGPRLFSLFPLDRSVFNPKGWIRAPFRLVLWCEHSRLPLPVHNGIESKKGIYDLELEREWYTKAAPYLKLLAGTLTLVLPVASSTLKVIDNTTFKTMEDQLGLGKSIIDGIAGESKAINEYLGEADSTKLEHGAAIRAENATLRELHALLKAKDPGFGDLVRVMNKRQEFLWVHEKFASEY